MPEKWYRLWMDGTVLEEMYSVTYHHCLLKKTLGSDAGQDVGVINIVEFTDWMHSFGHLPCWSD